MGFQIPNGPGGHGAVYHRFLGSEDGGIKRVGSQLGELLGKRIHADYRMKEENVETQKTARMYVRQAERMIRILDGCRSEPRRTKIIEAIRKWEKKTGQELYFQT
jgi:hypothetical protein